MNKVVVKDSHSLALPQHENDPPRLGLWWRVLIVLIATSAIWQGIGILAENLFGEDYSRQSHLLRAILTSLIVIPTIIASRHYLDRRPWEGLTLTPLSIGWRPLIISMVCWLIPAGIGLGLALALGWTDIRLRNPTPEVLFWGGALVFLVFTFEALPEELIFRGYFYRNLVTVLPRWGAVLGQTLLFVAWGMLNGGPITVERSALFFMAAFIIGIFRVITGTVWASIGFHLAFQTIAQWFGNIGDQFVLSEPQVLTSFAFGLLPFSISVPILNRFYPAPIDWQATEPEQTNFLA